MRFSSSTEAVSQFFGGEIARGKHLFPFRTEPLSLSAPMVLGGQPPGRVGRRRSYEGPPSRAALFRGAHPEGRLLLSARGGPTSQNWNAREAKRRCDPARLRDRAGGAARPRR